MLPDRLRSVEAPVHDPDELASGVNIGAGVTGTEGTAAGADEGAEATAAPPEEYEAAKPPASTELSAVNTTCMVPELAMTGFGTTLPLNDPSKGLLALIPSYTVSRS
jgi:hypothetical protein